MSIKRITISVPAKVASRIKKARERGWPVVTSDAADLLAIDPTLTVQRI